MTLTDVKFLPIKSLLPVMGMSLERSPWKPVGPGFGKASGPEMNHQYEEQPPTLNLIHLRKQGDYATSLGFNRLNLRDYNNNKKKCVLSTFKRKTRKKSHAADRMPLQGDVLPLAP